MNSVRLKVLFVVENINKKQTTNTKENRVKIQKPV